jgi:L-amino acid N-acyltransferase YncA
MTNERAPAIGGTPVEAAQYVIRAATVEDAGGIAEAHVASWQTAYRGLPPQALLDGLSVGRRTAQWQRDIPSGNFGVHVATDPAGHVGGFISTGRSRDDDATETVGELIAIYLRPQLWRLGIGGRLHAAGVDGLATRFEHATLWVWTATPARVRSTSARAGGRTAPSSATPSATPTSSRSATGGR